MGEIVNLRMARKRKVRVEKEQVAQENRLLHGRTKGERSVTQMKRDRDAAVHDGHRREREDGEG